MAIILRIETPAEVVSTMALMKKRLKKSKPCYALITGPVGAGKVMLARRLSALVPRPKGKDLEMLSWLYMRLRTSTDDLGKWAPFRAPHHTISNAGLIGSLQGPRLYPGEVSLAHAGTLLIDEVQEYRLSVLDDLHIVLQAGEVVHHVRPGTAMHEVVKVPAKPRLVLFTAPACPCGQKPRAKCGCDIAKVNQYVSRLDRLLHGYPIEYVFGLDLSEEGKEKLTSYKRPGD